MEVQGRAILRALAAAPSGALPMGDVVRLVRRPAASSAVTRASVSQTLRRLWAGGCVELTNLASRAHQAKLLELFERTLRLALRAQGQCRATLETLAVLKNPPVFARQANIANCPQQVNNGGIVSNGPARARGLEGAPNKLLEAHGERVDGHTAAGASASDSPMAPVGEVHGASDAAGQGARGISL